MCGYGIYTRVAKSHHSFFNFSMINDHALLQLRAISKKTNVFYYRHYTGHRFGLTIIRDKSRQNFNLLLISTSSSKNTQIHAVRCAIVEALITQMVIVYKTISAKKKIYNFPNQFLRSLIFIAVNIHNDQCLTKISENGYEFTFEV